MENRTKVKAVARANAFHGLFQAILQPEGVLTMDEIAERWADYARIERGFAKLQLRGFEDFILDQLAKGYQLDLRTKDAMTLCRQGRHCPFQARTFRLT